MLERLWSMMARKSRMAAWIAGSVGLPALVATIVLLHPGSHGDEADDAAASPHLPRKVVAVYPVTRRNLTRSITLSAELRPWNVVNIYAKVSGYLKDISVDYGSRVRAGQTIAILDLPEQQADLERTESAYRLARADYERLRSVVQSMPGLVAAADVDKARAAYEMTKDQRDYAASVLGYRAIQAPFDGIITKRYVDPGALIQQGTTSSTQAQPIVRLADISVLRLGVEVPESMVSNIHVGAPLEVTLPGSHESVQAHIARFSYDVHEESRTMPAEVDIPNADFRLKPGMYASITMALESKPNALTMPAQALVTMGSPSVWVVDGHDQLRQQSVSLGLQTSKWVEITKGLRVGDKVVFGDRSSLIPGLKVEPKLSTAISG